MDFIDNYLAITTRVINSLDRNALSDIVEVIVKLREREGRLFVIGVGGSAANASHAVNDFRKLALIEAYSPTDNVSELTARINDDGWESSFSNWLAGSRLSENDAVMVFSVGGGDAGENVSVNLIRALEYSKEKRASIVGIVGRNGGFTARIADACLIIPTEKESLVTPLAESLQAVVWHLLVSHPDLKVAATKW
jgi:D-sedoheptulose 7-phosphate isomerase